eukprot:gene17514-19264_t
MISGKHNVVIPKKDPWARFEAWRYHPELLPMRNVRRMFHGLGIGFGAFLVACVAEKWFFEDDNKAHNH